MMGGAYRGFAPRWLHSINLKETSGRSFRLIALGRCHRQAAIGVS
jgi:hypothetical protein